MCGIILKPSIGFSEPFFIVQGLVHSNRIGLLNYLKARDVFLYWVMLKDTVEVDALYQLDQDNPFPLVLVEPYVSLCKQFIKRFCTRLLLNQLLLMCLLQ